MHPKLVQVNNLTKSYTHCIICDTLLNGVLQWRATMACYNGVLQWRATMACYNGVLQWRATMACYNGVLQWRATMACYNGTMVQCWSSLVPVYVKPNLCSAFITNV